METKTARPRSVTVLLVLLTVGTAASIALAALSFWNSRSILALVAENFAPEEEETREDDVQIADEYTIRSTQQISDAYRTGDTSALDDKDRETLDMAAGVLDEILQDGMTPYEQEKAVYDWMTENLERDQGLLTVIPTTMADCDNPYGTLKYHNAVCVGYATTFRLFMQMLDIPCMVVHNTELYHSWDLVQLDGDWYHTDIYSDVGTGGYRHFNVTDASRYDEGLSWDADFFPAATSFQYSAGYQESEPGVDIFELPALVRAALDDGTTLLSYRYGADFTEEQAQVAYNMTGQIQDLLWSTSDYMDFSISCSFQPIDDGYLLTLSITRYESGSEVEISDADREKMDDAVNAAFGDLTGEESYPEDLGDAPMEDDTAVDGEVWFE